MMYKHLSSLICCLLKLNSVLVAPQIYSLTKCAIHNSVNDLINQLTLYVVAHKELNVQENQFSWIRALPFKNLSCGKV